MAICEPCSDLSIGSTQLRALWALGLIGGTEAKVSLLFILNPNKRSSRNMGCRPKLAVSNCPINRPASRLPSVPGTVAVTDRPNDFGSSDTNLLEGSCSGGQRGTRRDNCQMGTPWFLPIATRDTLLARLLTIVLAFLKPNLAPFHHARAGPEQSAYIVSAESQSSRTRKLNVQPTIVLFAAAGTVSRLAGTFGGQMKDKIDYRPK